MEQWLQQLIQRGLAQSGTVSFNDLDAIAPPEFLEGSLFDWLYDQICEAGISLIDDEDQATQMPSTSEPIPENEPENIYLRDAAFEQRLRDFGVPFTDTMVSYEDSGNIFDAELIVPGERALAAWLTLRNAVSATGIWPVIGRELNEATYGEVWPEQLDPRRRLAEQWRVAVQTMSAIVPRLTSDQIRADAAANIAEAAKVSPTPWTFRSAQAPGWKPPAFDEPDGPLPASEPDFAKLFSNDGPFRTVRAGFGGNNYPFHPFMRIRLYPTAVPWEVFAYSPFGGWNECPWPDEQLAMLKHWHAVCGAEVVSVREDWYDLFIPRLPRTRHQAIGLLSTHFGEDPVFRVSEGADVLEALSQAHHWHFWWH